jgi:hypothetical protein
MLVTRFIRLFPELHSQWMSTIDIIVRGEATGKLKGLYTYPLMVLFKREFVVGSPENIFFHRCFWSAIEHTSSRNLVSGWGALRWKLSNWNNANLIGYLVFVPLVLASRWHMMLPIYFKTAVNLIVFSSWVSSPVLAYEYNLLLIFGWCSWSRRSLLFISSLHIQLLRFYVFLLMLLRILIEMLFLLRGMKFDQRLLKRKRLLSHN